MKQTRRQTNAREISQIATPIDFEDLLKLAMDQINNLGRKVQELGKTEKTSLKEYLKRRFIYGRNTSIFHKTDQIIEAIKLELGKYLLPDEDTDEEEERFESENEDLRSLPNIISEHSLTEFDKTLQIQHVFVSKNEINFDGEDKFWFIVSGSNQKIFNILPRIDKQRNVIPDIVTKCQNNWTEEFRRNLGNLNYDVMVCHNDVAESIMRDFGKHIFHDFEIKKQELCGAHKSFGLMKLSE